MWREKFKNSVYAIKWIIQITLLGFFWLTVLQPYISLEYLVDEGVRDMMRDLISLCVKPSINDLARRLASIMALNLIFNMVIRYFRPRARRYHLISTVTGFLVLNTNSYPKNLTIILGFLFLCWLLLLRIQYIMRHYEDIIQPIYVISFVLITLLVCGEIFSPDYFRWHECRGVMMLMAMKLISVASDDYHLLTLTSYEFFGYLLCPATVLFGPWLSIQEYRLYNKQFPKLNWKWVVKIVQILTYAMIFMVISNCLNRMLIVPAKHYNEPCRWHEAFRNAFVFRSSNYFICYMAELTMLMAGFNDEYGRRTGIWRYTVSRPLGVEFPRSISSVVRNWNVPVHRFLKDHVYVPYIEVGQLHALVYTFFISSLLHGLNIRITAILISLGILALSQQIIQDKMSTWFSCCCRIMPCPPGCGHRFGPLNPMTLFINGFNMILNMFHMAYLGYVMDDNFEISSWRDLYYVWDHDFAFFTHHVIGFWFATMLLIA